MAEHKIFVSGDLSSDTKFKEALVRIRDRGFIKSHRSGDTGIGKTLEDELGIKENCVQSSDIGAIELKANRLGTSSKLTLFTKAPNKRGVNNNVLRKKYGYKTEDSMKVNKSIQVLHTSVNGQSFNTLNGRPFLKLTVEGDRLYIEHKDEGILKDVYWDEEKLKQAFDKKYPAQKMYHVQAESRIVNGIEEFHYVEAYSLENFSADKMLEGLKSGDLEIDIRLGVYASGERIGKLHDNGSAIRVSPSKLDKCFDTKTKLL